ncbi:MAG: zinc ABC transporter substrate-binding protein, partial [Candidatus Kerfeldbacteria bacterium]|nr:zinc ABC transporter substrate-binding protein [Candidatus Kerfeldbacteria bacterium]
DQIIAIHNSQLLVLNGSGLEPWSNDVLADVPSSVNVVSASDGLATLEGEDHEHAHEEDEHHEEEEAVTDPHVWLSPKLAKIQVQKITDAFIKADPIHADAYTTHSQTLQDRLAELDAEYEVGLAQCTSRVIITAHTAFAYLASTYGLEQLSIAGLTPDAEPSLSELGEIADFALQNNVQYIFFESLVSPKLSETIAREVGAQTLVLNPLEGLTDEQIADGQDYFTVMRENLTNLRTALQCQ